MAWETDMDALSWMERALSCDVASVRRAAVELLSQVDSGARHEWLARAARDLDPGVRASAALTGAQIAGRHPQIDDLFESDFAQGRDDVGMSWEWEYGFKVMRGLHIPAGLTIVWVREEDDALARQLALMKATVGVEPYADEVVAVLVRKAFVSRFTRSPRSMSEAMRWRSQGRPRYDGP